ncbi:MAG: sodium:solute symporter family protein [Cyanobacteria bacterium]|nr:sodium:solute symporter family protein [Cyanobacteriota bacterium]
MIAFLPWVCGCLLLYAILILGLGRFFSRKIKSILDFFLAGRSLSAWPVAFTFTAAWFGAASTIGSVNAYHQLGLSGLWELAIPSLLSCMVISAFFSKRVNRQQAMSQPEAVANYYGQAGRALLSCVVLASSTTLVGSQLVAAGQLLHSVLNVDISIATICFAIFVVSYSALGGYFTVVITDMTQTLFFTTALLMLGCFSLWAVWQHYPQVDLAVAAITQLKGASFWRLDVDWWHHCALVITFVLAWSVAPEMWQRMTSCRSETMAAQAAWRATICLAFLFVCVLLIGICSVLLVSSAAKTEPVLVYLATQLPHPALFCLAILGILAAVGSTMDSSINVSSLTVTHDLYQAMFRPNAPEQELIWVSRISTVLVVIPAVVIALCFQDIIRILWISADIYASCMFVPIVGLLWQEKSSCDSGRNSGLWAMGLGAVAVLLSASQQYHWVSSMEFLYWPQWPYSTLLGVGMSAVGYYVVAPILAYLKRAAK